MCKSAFVSLGFYSSFKLLLAFLILTVGFLSTVKSNTLVYVYKSVIVLASHIESSDAYISELIA